MKMKSLRIFAPYALLILRLVNWTHSHPMPMTKIDEVNLVADDSLSDEKFLTTGVNHGRTADPSSHEVLERVDPEKNAKTNDNFKSLAGDDAKGSQTNNPIKPKTPAPGEKKAFLQKLRSFFVDGSVKVWKKIKEWFSKANPFKSDKKKASNPNNISPKKDPLFIPEPKTSAGKNPAKETPNDSSVRLQKNGNENPREESTTPAPWKEEEYKQVEFFSSDRAVEDWEKIEKWTLSLPAFDQSEEVKGSQKDLLAFMNGRIAEGTSSLEKTETIPPDFPGDRELLSKLKSTVEDDRSQYGSLLEIVEKARFKLTKNEHTLLHSGRGIIKSAMGTCYDISSRSDHLLISLGRNPSKYDESLKDWKFLKERFEKSWTDRIAFNEWSERWKSSMKRPETKTSGVENLAKEVPNESLVHVQEIGEKTPQEESKKATPLNEEESQQDKLATHPPPASEGIEDHTRIQKEYEATPAELQQPDQLNPKTNPEKELPDVPENKKSAVEKTAKETPDDSPVPLQNIAKKTPQGESEKPTPLKEDESQQDKLAPSSKGTEDHTNISKE